MRKKGDVAKTATRYDDILAGMVDLLESARHVSARAVNSIITATYWEIGRRIVELEQYMKKGTLRKSQSA